MSLVRSEKTRQLLWFITLYFGGIIVIGTAAFILKAMLGQA